MKLNQYIDHTLLKADATSADIQQLCQEAKEHHFKTVCINPSFVSLAKDLLSDSDVGVCTVVGFPLGANKSEIKATEAMKAIEDGADEIDMVINIGALKEQDYDLVFQDIQIVAEVCHTHHKKIKVIIETALLNDEEKVKVCKLATDAGADFVKTSTGFSSGGATVHDIELMKKAISPTMEVKASGGIRDYQSAVSMIKAGATRLGASSSVAIVKGKAAGDSSY